jgi:hypothetical protein
MASDANMSAQEVWNLAAEVLAVFGTEVTAWI